MPSRAWSGVWKELHQEIGTRGLYIALTRSSANATDFFHIPYNRVVEMGSQVTV